MADHDRIRSLGAENGLDGPPQGPLIAERKTAVPEVLFCDSIFIEGELNPAWVEEQLLAIAEIELKKVEPDYPFGK
jgi:hypothetical protein